MTDDGMPVERWLPVPGWEGWYEVSDQGRVRSVDREVVHRDGLRAHYRGRLLTLAPNGNGYCVVTLCRPGVRAQFRVHVLVLLAFVGPGRADQEGCHDDGVRDHNHLSNLRWGTRSENTLDSVRHGTHPKSVLAERCGRGHLYLGANLKGTGSRAGRYCAACKTMVRRRWLARSRGLAFDDQAEADAAYQALDIQAVDPDWRPAALSGRVEASSTVQH